MAPIAYGVLATIAGIIVIAVLVGVVGGVVNGRLKGDISLGAILAGGTYFLVVILLESGSFGKIALFGVLPLLVTFVVGSAATRFFETRFHLRSIFASLAALGSALLAGFVYLMLIRVGWLSLTEWGTVRIAAAVFSCMIIFSIRKRLRATK
jgi:hypothetical protein